MQRDLKIDRQRRVAYGFRQTLGTMFHAMTPGTERDQVD
jgi:hypothetical protein